VGIDDSQVLETTLALPAQPGQETGDMIRIQLTPTQREELERVSVQAKEGRVAQRAQMVLLNAQGQRVRHIAETQHCSVETVRAWLKRYQQWGVAGLYGLPRE
jgi:DNA-directed RNA polymerase specialized sigma24 family protein